MAKKFTNVVRGQNRLEVNNAAETAELYLTGTVGNSWWDDSGITEKEVRSALKSIPKGKPTKAFINSEGGNVQEGLGIYNAFKERSADITAHISGYALSIASVFPLAAHKVVSPKSAIWMMHETTCVTAGNKADKLKDSEMLAEHDEMLAEIYAEETGKPIQEMREAMAAETWIRGSAAVEFGLADETDDSNDQPAAAYRPLAQNYLARCKNVSPEILNLFTGQSPPAAQSEGEPKNTPAKRGATQDNSIMNKVKIIALLKKHGVEAKDDWTDEQFETALNELAKKPAAAASAAAADNAAIADLQEQLKSERRTRITAEVKRRGENKIANDRIAKWVERAMADETVLDEIDLMPVAFAAGQPIHPVSIQVLDNPFDRIAKLPTAKERQSERVKNWDGDSGLYAEASRRDMRAGQTPMNSNTYSSTLTTSFLMDGAETNLQNVWAPLKAFTMEYTTDPFKPLATGVLKQVASTTATQTDATNFELGDTTINPVSVVMHQYTQPFNVSSTDMSGGLRLENLVKLNVATFADKLISVALTPVTTALFGAATVTSAAAAFNFSDLATLQAALKKSPIKNLILDGAYVARIANTPGFFQTTGLVGGDTTGWRAFGWDNICPNSNWTGAGSNVVGFACHPQAITGMTGLPLIPPNIPGGIFQQTTFTVPGIGATVMLSTWFNPATRKLWTSYDIIAGFKETDTTAGFLVTSA